MSDQASLSSEANSRKKYLCYKHTIQDKHDPNKHTCQVSNGGITRQKEHLIGTKREKKNITCYKKVPQEEGDALTAYEAQQDEIRKARDLEQYLPKLGDVDIVDSDKDVDKVDEDVIQVDRHRKEKKITTGGSKGKNAFVPGVRKPRPIIIGGGSSGGSNTTLHKPTKKRSPIDAFIHIDPVI